MEQIQYPGRKDGGHIHKFWAPKQQQQQQPQSNNPKPVQQQPFVKSKTPQPTTTTTTKSTIIKSTQNQQQQQPKQSNPKPLQAFMKSKTPQPTTIATTKSTTASQKKVVSFWEAQTSSIGSVKTSSSLISTCSKSMSSLIQDEPEVEEKRGFIPSDVAKDPMKKEFLINLSKKIFSPNDQSKRRKSLRVRRNRSKKTSSLKSK